MKTTKTFEKALSAIVSGKRVVALQSGMRTGKTVALTQIAVLMAMHRTDYVILVVCPSFRHLKTGAFRDLQNVIKAEDLTNQVEYNFSNYAVRFKATNSRIEYCAAMEQGEESIRGRSADICWINEGMLSADYQIYQALAGRCREQIWVDYNPSGPRNWWLESKVLVDIENSIKVRCSITDNQFLTQAQVDEIYRTAKYDDNFKAIYLDGEYANISELQIITNYEIMHHSEFTETFETASSHSYGLDFGYITSYNTIVEMAMVGGNLYVRELLYQRGMLNDEITKAIMTLPIHNRQRGVADSAEQKSIDDINSKGKGYIRLTPAVKGKDSVLFGLNCLKQVRIIVDSESQHIINDFQNYEWTRDRVTGEILPIPNKQQYDAHTIDAIRYCYVTYYQRKQSFATFSV